MAAAAPAAPPPSSTADGLAWAAVCTTLEACVRLPEKLGARRDDLTAEELRAARRALLFPKQLRAAVARGESLYPLMRLLLPAFDSLSRGKYGLKAKLLASAYVHGLGIAEAPDVRALRNKTGRQSLENSFSDALFSLLEPRMRDRRPSTWTVADVNAWLDRLAGCTKSEQRKPLFAAVLGALPALEHKWLAAVIIGELRLGISDGAILNAYHPDAKGLMAACSSLHAVCADPALRVRAQRSRFRVTLGEPFLPLLAHKLTHVMPSTKAVYWDDFFMQRKLDGERVLLHWRRAGFSEDAPGQGALRRRPGSSSTERDAGAGAAPPATTQLRFFSRRFLRQPARERALAEFVSTALAGLDEAILDGEMLGWDPRGGTDGSGAFMNHYYTRASRLVAGDDASNAEDAADGSSDEEEEEEEEEEAGEWDDHGDWADKADVPHLGQAGVHLLFNAFDLLWARGPAAEGANVDGDVTELPLARRLQLLHACVATVPTHVEVLPSERVVGGVRCFEQVVAQLEAAMYRQDEGLVLKRSDSAYSFEGSSSNRTKAWLKLKPEYLRESSQTLDCVIVGAWFGRKRRGAEVSFKEFLVAVRSDEDDETRMAPTAADLERGAGAGDFPLPRYMLTFGRSATANLPLRQRLKEMGLCTMAHWQRTNGRPLPAYFNVTPGAKWAGGWPDVVIKHDSLPFAAVVEMKASELVATSVCLEHRCGFYWRFPKVVRVHTKPVRDALSNSGLRAIFDGNNTRLMDPGALHVTAAAEAAAALASSSRGLRRPRQVSQHKQEQQAAAAAAGRLGAGGALLLSTHAHLADARGVRVELDLFHRGGSADGLAHLWRDDPAGAAAAAAAAAAAGPPQRAAQRARREADEALARLLDDPYAGLPPAGVPYHVCVLPQEYDKCTPPLPPPYNGPGGRLELQRLVTRLGGFAVSVATLATHLIVGATRADISVNTHAGLGHDVVHPSWLLDCEAARGRVRYQPRHLLHASPASRAAMARYVDPDTGDEHAALLLGAHGEADTRSLLRRTAAHLSLPPLPPPLAGGGLLAGPPPPAPREEAAAAAAAVGTAFAQAAAAAPARPAAAAAPPRPPLDSDAAGLGGLGEDEADSELSDDDLCLLRVHAMSLFRDHPPRWAQQASVALAAGTAADDAAGGGDSRGGAAAMHVEEPPAAAAAAAAAAPRRVIGGGGGAVGAWRPHVESSAAAGGGTGASAHGHAAAAAGARSSLKRPLGLVAHAAHRSAGADLLDIDDDGSASAAAWSHPPPPQQRLRRVAAAAAAAAQDDSEEEGGEGGAWGSSGGSGGGGGGGGGRRSGSSSASSQLPRAAPLSIAPPRRGGRRPAVASPAQRPPGLGGPPPPPPPSAPTAPRRALAHDEEGCVAFVVDAQPAPAAAASPPTQRPPPSPLQLAAAQFVLYRGLVRAALDTPDVNLVLVEDGMAGAGAASALSSARLQATKAALQARAHQRMRPPPPIVSGRWVEDCIARGVQLPLDGYVL